MLLDRGPWKALILLSRALFLLSFLFPESGAIAQTPPRHAPDTILVRFKDSAQLQDQALAHALVGGHVHKHFSMVKGLQAVRIPAGMHVKEALARYRKHPDVLYAEPDWIVHTQTVPNDPMFGTLWGLNNIGQSGGVVDADIDAVEAWDITTGSSAVVVAVIDTGIDYNHQDLSANMFRNTPDCNSNGIDDDRNGKIDDCFGIDTVNKDSNPIDDHNHGTHVAGTIGAGGNNGVGVVGVNWTVRLMACKFLDAGGFGWTSDAIDCLEYVKLMKDRGVNIVATNNSWGGGEFSQAMFDAIDAHRQRGILFIAAAGNSSLDNDFTPFYPASYYLPNVIAVAATTRTDAQAWFSNYGRRTVHLGAPGDQILSTTRGNTYSIFSGTSMATPHVTGVAALLKAQDPGRDWKAIRNLLLAGGETIPSMTTTITQKRLNARGALGCSNSTVLSRLVPVTDVVSGAAGTPIDLAALHINCANPNGNVSVTVNPGGQIVTLSDDGLGSDQEAGDGIYSGQWTPVAGGTYALIFPGGDVVTVQVPSNYTSAPTAFNYRTIAGANLNLSDDSSATISSPFPILFGGASFTTLFVSSNGNVNFTFPFTAFTNAPIPSSQALTLVAPWWGDLFPLVGTSQNVFWDVTGAAPSRELVVEWRNLQEFSCTADSAATVRFQVVFFEGSSDILFNYADATFGGKCAADRGSAATVGVQASGNVGTEYSFNSPSLSDNFALLWKAAPPPAISVTPGSRDFGSVPIAGSEDRTFIVQNVGGDVVNGTATTSAPFSIFSGGSYSLSMGQSQRVTVRFGPASTGTFLGNVTFSGAGGTTTAVTGTGISVSAIAPSNLTAAVASLSQINLVWQDNSNNETEFRIERKIGPGGTFAQIAGVGANTTGYPNTGLTPNTTYVYRVRACNTGGCSDYSNEATAATPSLATLTVTVRGSGGGTVTSTPAGISCSIASTCSTSFASGAIVTLSAPAGAASTFKEWRGDCAGATATCTVTMTGSRGVTAVFSQAFTDPTLTPGVTVIKAAHVLDLRAAINTVLASERLSLFAWTNALTPPASVIKAVDVAELCQALQTLAPCPIPLLVPGETAVQAAHITSLRSTVRSLE